MGGYKHNQLKSKSYEEIQKMFDNETRRVNTFIPMDSGGNKSKKGTEERKVLKQERATTRTESFKETVRMEEVCFKILTEKDWRLFGSLVKTNKHGDIRLLKDDHVKECLLGVI
ncbi:hypothetical protein Tco_1498942 [Tanacetum coccineum]